MSSSGLSDCEAPDSQSPVSSCYRCPHARSNEAKHRERFAVRAKHMTLDPAGNRYIKYIRNIRTIQVCRRCPVTLHARDYGRMPHIS